MQSLKRVLYIEDEPGMIELVQFILEFEEKLHFVVKAANRGEVGLSMMRQEKPDLILLDLKVPGKNGCIVYQEVKADKRLRDIPVILVTASQDLVDKMYASGMPPADAYLPKPFNPDEFLDNVYSLLAA